MKKIIIAAGLLALLLTGAVVSAQDTLTPAEICANAASAEDPATLQFEAAEDVLEDGIDYQAIFCTDLGPVYVDLYEDQTPVTVNNFVFLAEQGYYNSSVFHRVIADFMVQGGDPVGNPAGTGGPGYQFEDEFVAELNFDRPGLLAMANAGPATNGSQFFITTIATDWLNQKHTIFGEVITGQNVVESIPDNQANPALTTGLATVVIITDPASVEGVDFAFEPASREDVEAVFEGLPEKVSELFVQTLALDETLSGVRDTADWVALADEAVQEDLAAYYDSHGHEYNAHIVVTNSACDLVTVPFERLVYSIDVYASPEDATAAFSDEALATLQSTSGMETVESTLPEYMMYVGTHSGCERDDLKQIRGIKNLGRFVVTVDVAFATEDLPPDLTDSQIADALIAQLTAPFENNFLGTILRPER